MSEEKKVYKLDAQAIDVLMDADRKTKEIGMAVRNFLNGLRIGMAVPKESVFDPKEMAFVEAVKNENQAGKGAED